MVAPDRRRMRWDILPDHLLELSTDQMNISYGDLISMSTSCKNWSSFKKSKGLKNVYPEPWLLCSKEDEGYRLYEPCSRLKIDQPLFPLDDYNLLYSKDGWLAICHEESPRKPLLYEPFNMMMLSPPRLPFDVNVMAFSTTPSDPNCIYFALSNAEGEGTTVALWRPQEAVNEWVISESEVFHNFKSCVYSSNGSFLCCNNRGVLGSFNPQHAEWLWLVHGETELPEAQRLKHPNLMVYHQDLYLTGLKNLIPKVFQFNQSVNQWVEKDSLSNLAIFMDPSSAMPAVVNSRCNDAVYFITSAFGEPRVSSLSTRPRLSWRYNKFHLGKQETSARLRWVQPPYSQFTLADEDLGDDAFLVSDH